MQSIYSAKLGLKAQQQRMDIISANIANVSTVGYKKQTARFEDALYTQMIDPSNVSSGENLKQGSGALMSTTHRDFTSGMPAATGETLDICIDGDGFFQVMTSGGNVEYTRAGNFSVSEEDGSRYLVTSGGSYVLDENGSRITLPSLDISVSKAGQMTAGGTVFATLKAVTFTNKDGLSLSGSGCYEATEASGAAKAADADFRQGYLEASNVDISTEFVQLMRAQRSFSLAGKALSAWNEMANVTNNLRT